MKTIDNSVRDEITDHLAKCLDRMPILNELCDRSFPQEKITQVALLHYAETKTFVNIKNPARLYLCPHEANEAKKYFCYLYREEQGNFKPGENHADLLKPVCYDVGLTDEGCSLVDALSSQ